MRDVLKKARVFFFATINIILNFQSRIMHFKLSDWFTQSRLSAHIPINLICSSLVKLPYQALISAAVRRLFNLMDLSLMFDVSHHNAQSQL